MERTGQFRFSQTQKQRLIEEMNNGLQNYKTDENKAKIATLSSELNVSVRRIKSFIDTRKCTIKLGANRRTKRLSAKNRASTWAYFMKSSGVKDTKLASQTYQQLKNNKAEFERLTALAMQDRDETRRKIVAGDITERERKHLLQRKRKEAMTLCSDLETFGVEAYLLGVDTQRDYVMSAGSGRGLQHVTDTPSLTDMFRATIMGVSCPPVNAVKTSRSSERSKHRPTRKKMTDTIANAPTNDASALIHSDITAKCSCTLCPASQRNHTAAQLRSRLEECMRIITKPHRAQCMRLALSNHLVTCLILLDDLELTQTSREPSCGEDYVIKQEPLSEGEEGMHVLPPDVNTRDQIHMLPSDLNTRDQIHVLPPDVRDQIHVLPPDVDVHGAVKPEPLLDTSQDIDLELPAEEDASLARVMSSVESLSNNMQLHTGHNSQVQPIYEFAPLLPSGNSQFKDESSTTNSAKSVNKRKRRQKGSQISTNKLKAKSSSAAVDHVGIDMQYECDRPVFNNAVPQTVYSNTTRKTLVSPGDHVTLSGAHVIKDSGLGDNRDSNAGELSHSADASDSDTFSDPNPDQLGSSDSSTNGD